MIYPLDQLKPNTLIKPNTKTQNNISFLEFFIKSDFVILAFFEKIWLKYIQVFTKKNQLVWFFSISFIQWIDDN